MSNTHMTQPNGRSTSEYPRDMAVLIYNGRGKKIMTRSVVLKRTCVFSGIHRTRLFIEFVVVATKQISPLCLLYLAGCNNGCGGGNFSKVKQLVVETEPVILWNSETVILRVILRFFESKLNKQTNKQTSCPSLARFCRSHGPLRLRPFEGEKGGEEERVRGVRSWWGK